MIRHCFIVRSIIAIEAYLTQLLLFVIIIVRNFYYYYSLWSIFETRDCEKILLLLVTLTNAIKKIMQTYRLKYKRHI